MLVNQPRIILAAIFAVVLSVGVVGYTMTKALSSKDLENTRKELIALAKAGKGNTPPEAPPLPPKRRVELITTIPGTTTTVNDIPKVSMIIADNKAPKVPIKPTANALPVGNNTEKDPSKIQMISVSADQVVFQIKESVYTLKVGEVAKTTPPIKLLKINEIERKVSLLINDQEMIELY
jgi:hypothetical protein